jgi:hypothetical protein
MRQADASWNQAMLQKCDGKSSTNPVILLVLRAGTRGNSGHSMAGKQSCFNQGNALR